MKVTFEDHPGSGRVVMILGAGVVRAVSLTEHDERDVAAALAQRHAMAKVCSTETGEHTCSERPDHTGDHKCRACPRRWQRTS